MYGEYADGGVDSVYVAYIILAAFSALCKHLCARDIT